MVKTYESCVEGGSHSRYKNSQICSLCPTSVKTELKFSSEKNNLLTAVPSSETQPMILAARRGLDGRKMARRKFTEKQTFGFVQYLPVLTFFCRSLGAYNCERGAFPSCSLLLGSSDLILRFLTGKLP